MLSSIHYLPVTWYLTTFTRTFYISTKACSLILRCVHLWPETVYVILHCAIKNALWIETSWYSTRALTCTSSKLIWVLAYIAYNLNTVVVLLSPSSYIVIRFTILQSLKNLLIFRCYFHKLTFSKFPIKWFFYWR